MALLRSERGIGRGEVAESGLEIPIFVFFMLVCSVMLFIQHFQVGNMGITVALGISMLVFGVTVVRVDFGVAILVVAMLLSPEIDTGTGLSGERNLNLRYDDVLIVVIFLGVLARLAYEGQLRLWVPSPINIGIFAYYSVCIVATLLALQRGLGAWDERTAFFIMLKMLEFYMVFFLVTLSVKNMRDVKKLLSLFFVVAIIVSCYGIYTIGAEPRVSAPFEKGGTEPNTLGGYLMVVMGVSLALFLQAPKLRYKLMFLFIVGVSFAPFLYTLSRSSYVAFAVCLFVVALISQRYMFLGVVTSLLLMVSLALMSTGQSPFLPEDVEQRILYTFQEDGGDTVKIAGMESDFRVDKSTSERILVWRKVGFILRLGPQFFLFGGGVSWESVLDSQYARVLLETGVLGFLAFVFLQYRLLLTARQSYRWTTSWLGRGLAMGVFASTVALIVHSFGTISFLIVRIMEPYWFLMAMTVVVRQIALQEHREKVITQQEATAEEHILETDTGAAEAVRV